MGETIQLNLALILFLPWFLILGALYWLFPRQPRPPARWLFDTATLVVAVVAFLMGIHWAHANADPGYGRMWAQVLATALGYGIFLAVMTVAFFVRRAWLRRLAPH
ncbi:hypothetical protein [Marilutibacter aestuarii]|uniref:Transmembrane protein n=1 Tax=Marilutibacter aestuarii TaxID=1706195 RepID=A0A507ZTD1_9GAMM|nr:hypothetical protein [Lysobacter aestuarii]TQD39504.1 hypothetical protein FKV25_15160 [Lysobacter aestuarii]